MTPFHILPVLWTLKVAHRKTWKKVTLEQLRIDDHGSCDRAYDCSVEALEPSYYMTARVGK